MLSIAWAQTQAAPVASNAAAPGGAFGMFLPMILVFGIFYLLVFRPQQKAQKLKAKMLSELKRGEEVITNSGIYGKIIELADTFVMLQIANGVIIKVDRSQIAGLAQLVVPAVK